MPRGQMSPAARKRASAAAKRYWRQYRKAKAAGRAVPTRSPRRGRRRRGARRGRTPASANSFLGMTVEALLTAKRQIDQAMKRVRGLLGGD